MWRPLFVRNGRVGSLEEARRMFEEYLAEIDEAVMERLVLVATLMILAASKKKQCSKRLVWVQRGQLYLERDWNLELNECCLNHLHPHWKLKRPVFVGLQSISKQSGYMDYHAAMNKFIV